MLSKVLALSALAASAVAQDGLPSFSELLNQTRGLGYLNTFLAEYPPLLSAVNSLTNVTILAPNNAALRLFPWDPRFMDLYEGGADYAQAVIGYHIIDGVYENFTEQWRPYKTSLRVGEWSNVTGAQVVFGRYNWRGWVTEFFGGISLTEHFPVDRLSASAPIALPFNGGVVYPINDVLNIPGNLTKELANGPINGTTFVDLLEKAGILEEVEGLADVTVLAPSDEAFEAVGQAIADLSPEELVETLKYHIIPNNILYGHLLENGSSFATLQGSDVSIYINEEATFLQNAATKNTNVLIRNGVSIVIDNVLNPNAPAPSINATQEEGDAAFPLGAAPVTESAATTTGSGEAAAFTGAASSFKQGAVSVAAFAAAVGFAMNL